MYDPFAQFENDELYQKLYNAQIDSFMSDKPENLKKFMQNLNQKSNGKQTNSEN